MLDEGVLQGPFGSWHANSLFAVLLRTEQQLQNDGISLSRIQRVLKGPAGHGSASFQSVAVDLISRHCGPGHLHRTARKLARWNFAGDEAALVARVLEVFEILRRWCPPRVASAYLRTLFNGWVARRRMRHAEKSGVDKPCQCLLGCESGDDSIEHYSVCPAVWGHLRRDRPGGLGVKMPPAMLSFFLLDPGTSEEDVVRLAPFNYGVYRAANYFRFETTDTGVSTRTLLPRWVERGAEKSRARRLLYDVR
ncbi:unnamed protein product [Prorocentrum cordatum]|uniref:Uncharacterized protein n=1 Tax=Prorocentrum cordatum TaxID=2364126 RepID=A0ABN9Y3I0_9DINO|nr:unnamed protein product [Polarella glacialis]